MKKLHDFIVAEKKEACSLCGIEMDKSVLGTIAIHTTDPNNRYKESKRKFVMNYKLILCGNCFRKTMRKIEGIVYEK